MKYFIAAGAAAVCLPFLCCNTTPKENQIMDDPKAAIRRDRPGPRPVTLGTCTIEPWRLDGTIAGRIPQVMAVIDRIAARAEEKKTPLDIILLPEHIMHTGDDKAAAAEPLTGGPVLDACAEKARQYSCYVGAPAWTSEEGKTYNSLVIFDRKGAVAGVYHKAFPVVSDDGSLEKGISPGNAFPVFDLDFGRVGAQICFDEFYEQGWNALGAAGAELVLYTSATPGVSVVKSHAWRNSYYVLASTFRAPTVITDPLGGEVARTAKHMDILVETIDLDYRLLPWNALRDFGKALGEKYGDRIRQDWHMEEDLCILTSNDPSLPVQKVMDDEKLFTCRKFWNQCAVRQDEIRGGWRE